MEISLFKLFKIFFNTCFVVLVVFLLAVKADTAKAGCCVPVEDSAGNCFPPEVLSDGTEVCSSGVYHEESCSSIFSCGTVETGCCVPVENPVGNCFPPEVLSDGTEVCSSGVYHEESCASIFSCGIVESGEDDASETAGNGEKCKPGFTEYSGVCFPDDTGLSEISVKEIIVNVMQWILGIFGFIALIAFAISGIMYLLSAGSEDQVKKAKEAMKWSIVGVIVGLGGLVIVWAIDNALNGGWMF